MGHALCRGEHNNDEHVLLRALEASQTIEFWVFMFRLPFRSRGLFRMAARCRRSRIAALDQNLVRI
jgi:hypothetical protein